MKTEELKALQAPIKERYKKDPAAALVTLRAQGRIGEGTLGVARDAPEEQLKKLLELTERYCVVMQTIRNAPPVVVSR